MSKDPFSKIERIRAQAAHIKHESEHKTHETHEHEKHAGAEAATADLSRISEAIEKRMEKTFLGSRTLGRHVARQGDGEYTWVMPREFRSSMRGLKESRVIYNSHGFLNAYVKTLQEALGTEFFVVVDGHWPDTKLIITWKPPRKSHGH